MPALIFLIFILIVPIQYKSFIMTPVVVTHIGLNDHKVKDLKMKRYVSHYVKCYR